MRVHRAALTVAVVVLAGAASAGAQQKGTAKGNYATMPPVADTMRMADGQMVVSGHYDQVTFANDPASPLNNNKARCNSVTVIGKDAKIVSFSGNCLSMDAAGNGASFWWRQTEAGTPTCPTACGQFSYYSGFGKFAGITGTGTWKGAAGFADGTGMGTWEGSYETR